LGASGRATPDDFGIAEQTFEEDNESFAREIREDIKTLEHGFSRRGGMQGY